MPNRDLRSLALLLLLLLAAGAACRRGGTPTPATAPPAAPVTPAALLYFDNSGGIQDSLREPIRDAESFQRIWTRATSRQPSPPPLPQVDFRRAMVLVVSNGRMTPEDIIRVDSVGVHEEVSATGRREPVMQVTVRTIRGCGGFDSPAYPLAIVRVERFDGPIRITERRERAEGCTGAALAPVVGPLAVWMRDD